MMIVSFGEKSLYISGDSELRELLSSFMKNFQPNQIEPSNPATLVLELKDLLCKRPLRAGWNLCTSDTGTGWKEAIYVKNSTPLFSLEYDAAASIVRVFISGKNMQYFRLGAMYGMLLALYKDCIGLHGVTIKCSGQTIILSAPSGTGKSTLARLLEEYGNARVINGDFALLHISGNDLIFEPTPFCGTSGICLNERMIIDHIVFLSQSKENRIFSLAGRQAITSFMSNVFIPTWDEKLRQNVLQNSLHALSAVKTHSFSFAPEAEAARVFYQQLIQQNISTIQKEETSMDISEIKFPTSKAEMEEIRKLTRQELPEDMLDDITGGNDDLKGKRSSVPWTCPGCGATVMIRQVQDAAKHMTKCPGNPYK